MGGAGGEAPCLVVVFRRVGSFLFSSLVIHGASHNSTSKFPSLVLNLNAFALCGAIPACPPISPRQRKPESNHASDTDSAF